MGILIMMHVFIGVPIMDTSYNEYFHKRYTHYGYTQIKYTYYGCP